MSEVAAKVRQAADHIEKYGLHKGRMWPEGAPLLIDGPGEVEKYIRGNGVPCCTAGALQAYGVNHSIARDVVAEIAGVSREPGWDEIPEWNDAEERTADEVVAVLRVAADKLEEDARA